MAPLFPRADTIGSIAAAYGLGDVLSVELLSGGTTQANYLLKASSGRFVLRFYVTRSAEYIGFEIDVLNQLAAAHFQCQQPIADRGGRFIGQDDGQPFAVFQYIEGEHDYSKRNHVQVASTTARMHSLSQAIRFESSSLRERYDQQSCLRTARSNFLNHNDGVRLGRNLEWLESEVENLTLPSDLPLGLSHCDLNPGNFLYKNGMLAAMLDFDMAAHTALLYDVANLLYWWANPALDEVNWQSRAKEILLTYQEMRPLTAREEFHLYDMFKLNFLMSIAWFVHLPNEIASDRRGVDILNRLGRHAFRERLFGLAA